MKNFFKKNQIIVFVIGLMVITAGYLNFSNNENNQSIEAGTVIDSEEMAGIGDAKLVSANVSEANTIDNTTTDNETINVVTNNVDGSDRNLQESNNIVSDEEIIKNTINEENIETNAVVDTDDYFTNSRLDRNTMYSQRIENYQDILSNTNVSETQKKTAQEEITKINEEQNAIMIAENLIKTKGIEDLVIFVNGDSVNVIVKSEELKEEEIAQIQNIVTRELEADIENIHIMNKN